MWWSYLIQFGSRSLDWKSHQSSTWVCLEKRHTAKLHVWGKWCLWIWGCPIFRQTHPFSNQNVLASIADGQVSQSLLRPFEELGPKPGFLALRGTEPAEHTIQSCMYIYIMCIYIYILLLHVITTITITIAINITTTISITITMSLSLLLSLLLLLSMLSWLIGCCVAIVIVVFGRRLIQRPVRVSNFDISYLR